MYYQVGSVIGQAIVLAVSFTQLAQISQTLSSGGGTATVAVQTASGAIRQMTMSLARVSSGQLVINVVTDVGAMGTIMLMATNNPPPSNGGDGGGKKIDDTHGLQHSFDEHAREWFGRPVPKGTHFELWRALVKRGAQSTETVPWSLRGKPTIGHLSRIDGKWFFVQFYESGSYAGELATAFVPNQGQLTGILKLLGK